MENLTVKIASLLNIDVEKVLHTTYGEIQRQLEKKNIRLNITIESIGIPKDKTEPIMEMKTGLEIIALERNEQLNKHGISIEWDVDHNATGELIAAAEAVLSGEFAKWPKGDHWKFSLWEKIRAKSTVDQIAIAGAFIAAEIDRLIFITKKS